MPRVVSMNMHSTLKVNSSLKAGLISLLIALPSPGYGLDCVQKKNVNAEIKIFAIPYKPEKGQYIFKIFTPTVHEGFRFQHMSLIRNMGKEDENISMKLSTNSHNNYQVTSVTGELKELERWVVSVSYYLEGVDPNKDKDFVCPMMGGFASLKNNKPFKEMSAAKRGAI
jgi:hypothetical protein